MILKYNHLAFVIKALKEEVEMLSDARKGILLNS